jgi:hypothetical protein
MAVFSVLLETDIAARLPPGGPQVMRGSVAKCQNGGSMLRLAFVINHVDMPDA